MVVTPNRRTSSGSRGSACATRFCTSCCALSGSVPSLKVTVSISSDSTPAKIGRSMKNLDRFMVGSSRLSSAITTRMHLGLGLHRHRLGCDECARPNALQAVDDDALAGIETRSHDAQPVDVRA